MTTHEDRKDRPCPQCLKTEDALFPNGVHPVTPLAGQEPSDMQVEVWICQQCGHIMLQQVA